MYYLMWTQGWSGNPAYREFALSADSFILIIDSVLSDKISLCKHNLLFSVRWCTL